MPAGEQLDDSAWWEGFNDPVLSGRIRTTLEANLDLPIAAARTLYLQTISLAGGWQNPAARQEQRRRNRPPRSARPCSGLHPRTVDRLCLAIR